VTLGYDDATVVIDEGRLGSVEDLSAGERAMFEGCRVGARPYAVLVEMLVCDRCGSPLPEEARFCPRCGAPVAAFTTEERKVVTILFADLAGSTELAARLDPERFREVMGAFYRSVSEELESLRGRAEKFIGDAVMAVWGLPHAHDDDALRAVRAGFAIRDRMARLGESLALPIPLQVRVGLNTGAVATGSGVADQFLVSGAPVNLAARLQEAAEPGEILVGETTWHLTQHAVAYGAARSVAARGFPEEVKAWSAEALSTRSTRRTIPLVDRRRELTLLVDAFARVRESGRAHLITIFGEPGIGKSRLVDEFIAGLPDGVKVLTGGASDFEEDVTFAPIAEMIMRDLGVERDAPPAVIRERLEDVVKGCCEASEVERVAARLGLALGLGVEERDRDAEQVWSERLSRLEEYVQSEPTERHRYRAAEVRAGLQSLLEGMSRQGPVVMVLEDLQAAKSDLLEMVEHIVRGIRRSPVLFVCLARDELLEHSPGWAGGISDAVSIRLEPLDANEAKELALAAGENIDNPTAERIVRHAGGNPFFIVETTGMLLQRHEAHDTGTQHTHVLPPTVQAVVAARLDHLPDDARDLIRKASVFARSTFSEWELGLIAEVRADLLGVLEEEEFLVRDPDRESVWRFRHDMLRDVAYESLAKRDRLRLHVQVADGLAGSAEADRYPQVIAYHLAKAAQASLDLDPTDRSLADRAVKALQRAGDLARWRMESRAAVDLYQEGLDLAGPEEGWGRREARMLSGTGEASYWLGEFERARAALTRALDVAGSDPWTRCHASRFLGDILLNVDGQPDEAEPLFEEALAAAVELDDPYAMARTLLMAGWSPYWKRDFESARRRFEDALSVARSNPERDEWAEARALVSLTSIVSAEGTVQECLDLGQQALELGRSIDDPFTIAVAQENVGNSLRRLMRLDEAMAVLDPAVQTFRDLDARWELASTIGDRGQVHRLAGRLDQAEADFKEAVSICRRIGEKSLITWTAGQLVLVLLAKGDRKAARRLVEDPSIQGSPNDRGAQIDLRTSQALVDLADGDRNRAEPRLLKGLELIRSEGLPNPTAARVVVVAALLGSDAAGGEEQVAEARQRLEQTGWLSSIVDAEQMAAAVAPTLAGRA
jgi:class 3 adenylate cyclase/tetratricopeptide (TPR) repeat protein